jgi:hypothetical protein
MSVDFFIDRNVSCCIPQKPVSSPTEKQLASLLNATDKETGPADSSMTGLVFIFAILSIVHLRDGLRSACDGVVV